MFDKINVSLIIRRHYQSLYDNRTGSLSWRDRALFLGVPIALAVILFAADIRMPASSAFLAGVAALAAFLFALLILVLQMSADTATASDEHGATRRLLNRVRILRELAANVAYSVVIAIGATVWLAIGEFLLQPTQQTGGTSISSPEHSRWYSAVTAAILAHLALTLLMVIKRTFAITERELDNASVHAGKE